MSDSDPVTAGKLSRHLDAVYDAEVVSVEGLDLGTFRVDRAHGDSWVARVFPAERPIERTRGDAEILRLLAELEFPAERCASAEPVSAIAGGSLLVTEFVPAVPAPQRREAVRHAGGLRALGWFLGRLHTLPSHPRVLGRPGGAWHHLADVSPATEIAALTRLLRASEHRTGPAGAALFETLVSEVLSLDDGAGLPESFVHPDFALANVVASAGGGLVVVDWTGAGRAARMWSLAFLLWSVGFGGDLGRVDRTVDGYRRHIAPEPAELERLEALIGIRPTVFATWAFCTGRRTIEQALAGIAASRVAAAAIADRARAALSAH